ncbi:protein of unknown function (plasmid) [Caballeronia sp. S22]
MFCASALALAAKQMTLIKVWMRFMAASYVVLPQSYTSIRRALVRPSLIDFRTYGACGRERDAGNLLPAHGRSLM